MDEIKKTDDKVRQRSFLKPLLIILVLVILLGGGFLVYTDYFQSSTDTETASTVTPVVTVAPRATATATADVTAGWKAYSNSTIGFSFKYPNTWKDLTLTKSNNTWGSLTKPGTIYTKSDDDDFNFAIYSADFESFGPRALNKTKINPNWTTSQFVSNMELADSQIVMTKKLSDTSMLIGFVGNNECSPNLSIEVVSPLNTAYPNLEILMRVNYLNDSDLLAYIARTKTDTTLDICDQSEPFTKIANKVKNNTFSDAVTQNIVTAQKIAESLVATK